MAAQHQQHKETCRYRPRQTKTLEDCPDADRKTKKEKTQSHVSLLISVSLVAKSLYLSELVHHILQP